MLESRRRVGASLLWLTLTASYVAAFGMTRRPAFYALRQENGHFIAMRDAPVVTTNETFAGHVMSSAETESLLPFAPSEWQEYETTVRTVMDQGRITKRKDKPEDVSRAMEYLLSQRSFLPAPILTAKDSRDCMRQQKENFLSTVNLTETQHELAMRTLTYLGDHCAKKRSPTPLFVAWQKLNEAGMVPRENCISTFMYALSLSNTTDITAQVTTFHDLFYPPNEKTITLRIKSMIASKDAAGALALLQRSISEHGEWQKLRTFAPVLELYCSNGDMTSALRLYRQMQDLSRVHFEADTYALLIGALAEQGYFHTDSPSIPGVEELGFSNAKGPGLLDELVTEMAADILELNNASARVMYNGFVKGFSDSLKPLADNEEIAVDNTPAKADELAIGRVSLNDNTAICPKTKTKLQLFHLDDEQRRNVHDTLLEMAGLQYEKFISELKTRFKQNMHDLEGKEYAVRELKCFSDWLNEREGEPFTAIVDGANVAYYGHGKVHYSQVNFVVKELERMNERPLVIMPQKYTAPKFNLNLGSTQELSDRDLTVLKELNDTGKLYTVPSKCLDDYYWMLASASNQTVACGSDTDMNVLTSNSDGRFPGLRPMLITNDQMRDHRWDLLEPRLFRRWCSCHIVNFNLSDFVEDEWADREVDFCAADFFSNEIQGNPPPGIEEGSTSGTTWHFPVSDWGEHERLCIRVPL